MGLAEKIAQMRASQGCCHYPANWQASSDVRPGWLKFHCRVCGKWVGSRPQNPQDYYRSKK